MALTDLHLIKGYLLDKNPPQAVTDALDAVIRHVSGIASVTFSVPPAPPAIAPEALAAMLEADRPISGEDDPASADDVPAVKKRREWSPEARAAAAERMKAAREKRWAGRVTEELPEGNVLAPPSGA